MKKFYIGLAALFCLVLSIHLGAWYFKRWANYKLGYQSMVREEIKTMVVDGCLRE